MGRARGSWSTETPPMGRAQEVAGVLRHHLWGVMDDEGGELVGILRPPEGAEGVSDVTQGKQGKMTKQCMLWSILGRPLETATQDSTNKHNVL